jgi:hypothetical protein
VLGVVVQNMVRMQSTFQDPFLRDLAVELCLTVPVKLEAQLPCIPMLLQPLHLALLSRPERNHDLAITGCVACMTEHLRSVVSVSLCGLRPYERQLTRPCFVCSRALSSA